MGRSKRHSTCISYFSRSLSLIAPRSAVHEVITDRGAPKSDLRVLKQSGIEVTLV